MIRCEKCNNIPCHCNRLQDDRDSSSIEQPPIMPVDLFGSPFNCRKQKRTRRYASPNSKLSSEELDELQFCIEEANDLLRSLGSESDPNNTRQLQLHFLNLRGALVSAKILCGLTLPDDEEEEEFNFETNKLDEKSNTEQEEIKVLKITGKLATAGRDFVQINSNGSSIFVLYEKLVSLSRSECKMKELEQEFIDADQSTRRELAFHFGDFVSKNNDLVNLFFGVPLYAQLKEYLGKDVKGRTDGGRFKGTLVGVDEGKIQLLNKDERQELDLRSICFLEVLHLK